MISKMLDVYAKIQNDNHIVKINYRICKDKLSLYMSYRKTVNSQTINKRKSLNIFLTGNKKEDLNKIEFAMNIRNEFEKNLGSGLKIFQNDSERIFLVDYAKALSLKYTNVHSRKNISAVASHLKKFGCIITLSQVDKKFILDFMNYLDNSCPKAASFYFTKFKQVLYRAISDEIIPDIPFLRNAQLSRKSLLELFLQKKS